MAHENGGQLYRKLGEKIDSLQTRAPWNETFFELLKTLYAEEEAEVVIKMPFGLASLETIEKATGFENAHLRKILDNLCTHGLVIDLFLQGEYRYMPAPMVVGIFELVMMRTGDGKGLKQRAELFHRYMHGDDSFYAANCNHNERIAVLRTLPYEESVTASQYVEVLDYEKATAIVEDANRFAIGLCSCRNEKLQVGEKKCEAPLEICSSFGAVADFAIRRGLAKEVSKEAMLDNLARSKALKLTLTADNVRERVNYICHCCKCCCNLMLGVTQHGYPNSVVTSSFISEVNREKCTGCERCVEPCPVNAIEVLAIPNPKSKKNKTIRIDQKLCLGCGVCSLVCALDGINLVKRKQRVIHPQDTFERVILMCLERGTLENQIFVDPQSVTQKVMRAFVGGFLRIPPVKQALMSDMLRSSFLSSMRLGIKAQGKKWILDS